MAKDYKKLHQCSNSCFVVRQVCFKTEHKHDRVACWTNGRQTCGTPAHTHHGNCFLNYKKCGF